MVSLIADRFVPHPNPSLTLMPNKLSYRYLSPLPFTSNRYIMIILSC